MAYTSGSWTVWTIDFDGGAGSDHAVPHTRARDRRSAEREGVVDGRAGGRPTGRRGHRELDGVLAQVVAPERNAVEAGSRFWLQRNQAS